MHISSPFIPQYMYRLIVLVQFLQEQTLKGRLARMCARDHTGSTLWELCWGWSTAWGRVGNPEGQTPRERLLQGSFGRFPQIIVGCELCLRIVLTSATGLGLVWSSISHWSRAKCLCVGGGARGIHPQGLPGSYSIKQRMFKVGSSGQEESARKDSRRAQKQYKGYKGIQGQTLTLSAQTIGLTSLWMTPAL